VDRRSVVLLGNDHQRLYEDVATPGMRKQAQAEAEFDQPLAVLLLVSAAAATRVRTRERPVA
jgi:hypothetical protein